MGLPVLGEEPTIYIFKRPIMTYILLGVNTLVFIVLSIIFYEDYDIAIYMLGTRPYDLFNPPTFYRIFTSMFVHADILHLFGNMLFLFMFGRDIEKLMGTIKFFIFYMLAGIIATIFNALSIYLLPQTYLLSKSLAGPLVYDIPAVGASGAISGILGAYLILFPRSRVATFIGFIPVIMTSEVFITLWFIYQLFGGLLFFNSGIAFWAHIGGFIGGLALMPFFIDEKRLRMIKRLTRYVYPWF